MQSSIVDKLKNTTTDIEVLSAFEWILQRGCCWEAFRVHCIARQSVDSTGIVCASGGGWRTDKRRRGLQRGEWEEWEIPSA